MPGRRPGALQGHPAGLEVGTDWRLTVVGPGPGDSATRRVPNHPRVALAATRPRFGDERWWFIDDGRRVAWLYLAQGDDQFRSRIANRDDTEFPNVWL
jgi:hypothetical protein